MPWSIMTATSTTPHQAVQGQLVLFDLATAAADSIVNVPSSPAVNTYFGVTLNGQALGFKLEVKTGGTVLYTLNVDNESVWLVYTGSTWRVVARFLEESNFEARFAPVGAWLSDGADANLVDISGNGKDIAKSVTIPKGIGYGQGRFASSYSGRYARASDAAFQLLGAMSYEFLAFNFLNGSSSGYMFQCGSGSGQANNFCWALRIEAGGGTPRLQHRQQSGVNVNADLLGPVVPYGAFHVCVARAAPSGGTTLVEMYVNGGLAASGNLTTPTDGTTSQLFLGGTSGAQAPVISQWASVIGRKVTAAEAAYLARLRLSKLGPLGP